MPRPLRLQFEDAFYHVFNRGNRRARLFHDAADYREFEELLLDGAARDNVHLYKWRLMPNHFHIALQTPDANLAAFMQRLLGRYARYYNRRYQKIGHVFQGRYGMRVVDKEAYFLELLRYIELNAMRAKKWPALVAAGEDQWSSLRYYLHGNEPGVIAPFVHEVLRRFGDDIPTARQRFRVFIEDGLRDPKALAVFSTRARLVGSDHFIEDAKRKAGLRVRQYRRLSRPSREQLLQATWEVLHVTAADLRGKGRHPKVVEARRAIVEWARQQWRVSTSELAVLLNKSTRAIADMDRRHTASSQNWNVEKLDQWLASQPVHN